MRGLALGAARACRLRIFSPRTSMTVGCAASPTGSIRDIPPRRKSFPWRSCARSNNDIRFVRGLALRPKCIRCICRSPGTNFMIAFASPEGLLLDIVSDNSFIDHVGRREHPSRRDLEGVGLRHQRPWHASRISNARSTVHGGEHFFPRYNNLTCTAGPGVRARRRALRHSRRVVGLPVPAGAYPRRWSAWRRPKSKTGCFANSIARNIIIAFHNRGEYLHTLSAGLLATDHDGASWRQPSRASAVARIADLPGQAFQRRVPHPFQLLPRGGAAHERQKLQDEVGSHFVATIENPRQFPFAADGFEAKTGRRRRASTPRIRLGGPQDRGYRAAGRGRRRRGRCRF